MEARKRERVKGVRDKKRRPDKVSGLMDFLLCKKERVQTANVCTQKDILIDG